ncbi:MAG: lytic transglycosylase domain-containing protein, partial [Parasphingopyxis sp.]
MKRTILLAATLTCLAATPALADSETSFPRSGSAGSSTADFDDLLNRGERDTFSQAFAAIRTGDWETARQRIASQPRSVLYPVAMAELYLAPGSPRVEADEIAALLSLAPDIPEASRLAAMGAERGMVSRPAIPQAQSLRHSPRPSRRSRAQSVSDSASRQLMDRIQPLIVDDSPSMAESLINEYGSGLPFEGLTEARQRVAWSYYLTGDDRNAQRLARQARQGSGDWAVQADWVDGLASWRARDCDAAADAFASVGRRAPDTEMRAAGLYWAARSEMACGRPQNVQENLRTAAQLTETFYGMIAGQALGIAPGHEPHAILTPGWDSVQIEPNARRALA